MIYIFDFKVRVVCWWCYECRLDWLSLLSFWIRVEVVFVVVLIHFTCCGILALILHVSVELLSIWSFLSLRSLDLLCSGGMGKKWDRQIRCWPMEFVWKVQSKPHMERWVNYHFQRLRWFWLFISSTRHISYWWHWLSFSANHAWLRYGSAFYN